MQRRMVKANGIVSSLRFLWLDADGGSNTGGAVLQQFFSERQLAALMPLIDPSTNTGAVSLQHTRQHHLNFTN